MKLNFFNFLLKELLRYLPGEVKSLSKLIKALGSDSQSVYRELINNAGNIGKKLTGLTTQQKKEIYNEVNKTMKAQTGEEGIDTSILSSSALVSGSMRYYSTAQAGDLTITFKEGGSYTYPSVPSYVWEQMKKATGSHGNGAMSVFWQLYLRDYKASPTAQALATAFKLTGARSIFDATTLLKKRVAQQKRQDIVKKRLYKSLPKNKTIKKYSKPKRIKK